MKYERIKSFTGLRFIMIMLIVFSHFEYLQQCGSIGSFYGNYLHNPTLGVDFFFLVSGFGMMLGNLNKIKYEDLKCPNLADGLKYGLQHVKKIYPVYMLTICIGFIWDSLSIIAKHADTAKRMAILFGDFILNTALLQSLTGMEYFTHIFNGVSWFLSCLFCIYLVSPLLIFILRKISKSIWLNLLYIALNTAFIIILAVLLGKLTAYSNQTDSLPNFDHMLVYGTPYRRVFYVLIGMNLALIYARLKDNNWNFKNPDLMEFFSVALAVAFFFVRKIISFGPNTVYLFDIIVCAQLVFIFSFDKGCISSFLAKPAAQTLGNMSMYIFLLHYQIRVYLLVLVEHFKQLTPTLGILLTLVILISTFIISYLFYRWSNKKARNNLSKL